MYRREFQRDSERVEVNVSGPIVVDEPAILTRIAVDGAGIAYQFAHQVDSMLVEGQLVQLLEDWTPAFPGFYVYYTSRRQMAPHLPAFVDFLSKQSTASP